jgi:hypothetical protein
MHKIDVTSCHFARFWHILVELAKQLLWLNFVLFGPEPRYSSLNQNGLTSTMAVIYKL